MYQLMAKCEELSKSMKPIYKLAEQMSGFNSLKLSDSIISFIFFSKELKRLLDLFESAVGN